jgi:HEAT repeat protein
LKRTARVVAVLIIIGTLASLGREVAVAAEVEHDKESLIKGRPDQQQTAMANLAKGDKKAAVALCDVIENEKDTGAKSRAAYALEANLKNPANQDDDTLSRLEQMVSSPDQQVVRLSASSIMQFKKNPRARTILRKLAKEHPDQQVRANALGAFMVNIDGDRSEIPFVESFLNDKAEYVRVWAAGYLGTLGDKKGLELCRDVLSREPKDDKVRALQMRAAIAAGRIGDPSLIPVLRKVGGSNEYGIAKSEALTAIKDIELQAAPSETEKIAYMKDAIGRVESARWAAQHLMADGSAEAVELLKATAADKSSAGKYEAQRAVAAIEARQAPK